MGRPGASSEVVRVDDVSQRGRPSDLEGNWALSLLTNQSLSPPTPTNLTQLPLS